MLRTVCFNNCFYSASAHVCGYISLPNAMMLSVYIIHLYLCFVGKKFKKYHSTSLLYIDESHVYESWHCCKAACFRDNRCVGFYYRRGICLMSHTSEIIHIQQRDVGNANMISTASESVIVYIILAWSQHQVNIWPYFAFNVRNLSYVTLYILQACREESTGFLLLITLNRLQN